MAELIKMPFGEQTPVSQKKHILDGIQTPEARGTFGQRHVPAHYNVRMHECILANVQVCPADAMDECIHHIKGDAAFCQITLHTCF